MARIVVNKHVIDKSSVTAGDFQKDGEIVISNEVGNEGIFIRNSNKEPVFISANFPKHVVLTQNQYDTMIKEGKVIIDGKEIISDENTYYAIIEEQIQ